MYVYQCVNKSLVIIILIASLAPSPLPPLFLLLPCSKKMLKPPWEKLNMLCISKLEVFMCVFPPLGSHTNTRFTSF